MEFSCAFRSFFHGGFECSSHRRADGRRLDLIAATGHEAHAYNDYSLLVSRGMLTCRDGMRWHLMEPRSGVYDFSSFLPMLRASQRAGVQVIWDLCHYGWPDDLDVFSPEFVSRFARFSKAVATVFVQETDATPYFTPINEPSFLSWAGAEKAFLNPGCTGRGIEMKMQLIRATIAGIEAIRDVCPNSRFVQSDPIIHIVPRHNADDSEATEAEAYRNAQFQGWDMLTGLICPELGGNPVYLDIIGCNYYVHNQWEYGGEYLDSTDLRYRAPWRILAEVYERYGRPLYIAETGIEGTMRPQWLRYVTEQAMDALSAGIPVEGLCLYPIVSYPGWDDERHCESGLWEDCNNSGLREVYVPLDQELIRQRRRINRLLSALTPGEIATAGSFA